MNWDDQSSSPVLYRSQQTPVANKSLLERIFWTLNYCGEERPFVVRGLLKPFRLTIWSIPGLFEVFRCLEQLVIVLEPIARPTRLCLLNCEVDGIRVLPGTLDCSEKEAELRQRHQAAEGLHKPSRGAQDHPEGPTRGPQDFRTQAGRVLSLFQSHLVRNTSLV